MPGSSLAVRDTVKSCTPMASFILARKANLWLQPGQTSIKPQYTASTKSAQLAVPRKSEWTYWRTITYGLAHSQQTRSHGPSAYIASSTQVTMDMCSATPTQKLHCIGSKSCVLSQHRQCRLSACSAAGHDVTTSHCASLHIYLMFLEARASLAIHL